MMNESTSLSREETVWLRVYSSAISRGLDTRAARAIANTALLDFESKFPHKETKQLLNEGIG